MVLLGVDVGGTSIRAVACTPSGAVLGRGSSRGGNLRSSAGDIAGSLATAMGAALTAAHAALSSAAADSAAPGPAAAASTTADSAAADDGATGVAPDRPATSDGPGLAVCVGAAGAGRARRDEVEDLVRRAIAATLSGPQLADLVGEPPPDAGPLDGRDGRALLLTDLDIAYRSAATTPDGALLLAGTGAVAAAFAQWRQIRRRDGLGWLLGDTGSGVWLGRRVLRAVAAELDHTGPATAMTPSVLAMLSLASAQRAATVAYPRAADPPAAVAPADPPLLGLDVDPQDLVRAVDRLAPAEWGRFAGTALNAAKTDRVAASLVDEAAAGLLATLAAAGADAGGAIVLAGGLLASGALRARIEAAHPGCTYAPFPVVGACAAAAELAGLDLDREALTDALL